MSVLDIVRKKRFGNELNETEIREFIKGVSDKSIPDYQVSAMLMAICIQGMSDRETLALTLSMAKSGETLNMKDIEGVKCDKHSTGGVGDTTTLIVAPLAASCGVKMAKMSGRGLDFTGGTLDKLESIPGLSIDISIENFKKQVRDIGIAVIGQSAELAPADKVMYPLRDVTGTVDCVPLIVSSILSKKIAAGCDVVILDVKYGSGGLTGNAENAKALAEYMVKIGAFTGRKYSALVTSMEQPLGNYIGNALEVEEAIEVLSGRAGGDLLTVSVELAAHIIRNAGIVENLEKARTMLMDKLRTGEGLRKLAQMIAAQGGNPEIVNDISLLPKARKTLHARAAKNGIVSAIDAKKIGIAARALGAGRIKKTDTIDPAVGLILKKRVGDRVEVGETLVEMRVNDDKNVISAMNDIMSAYKISDKCEKLDSLIKYVIE